MLLRMIQSKKWEYLLSMTLTFQCSLLESLYSSMRQKKLWLLSLTTLLSYTESLHRSSVVAWTKSLQQLMSFEPTSTSMVHLLDQASLRWKKQPDSEETMSPKYTLGRRITKQDNVARMSLRPDILKTYCHFLNSQSTCRSVLVL